MNASDTNAVPKVDLSDVAWLDLFPSLRLFRSFKQAIHPSKMFLAWMLVVLLYLGGRSLDLVFYEADGLPSVAGQTFVVPVATAHQRGVFMTVLTAERAAFKNMVESATVLDFGLRDLLGGKGLESGGVFGALGQMVCEVPSWLYQKHPEFLAIYLLYTFLLVALVGAAIARLAALQACRDIRPSPFEAVRFAAGHYVWFVLAPVIPLAVAALFIALPMIISGLLFFNVVFLDVIGSILFGLPLLGGFLIAMMIVGLAGAINLLTPAIAVEGTDAFDAISRSFYYVFGRPWRYLFYTAVFLVYGAITYLFVGFVLFLALWFTNRLVGIGAFADVSLGVDRFDAIMPGPQLGEPAPIANFESLDLLGDLAAFFVTVYRQSLLALVPAFAVSYYFSGQTWIYLLLRRAADGVALDDVHVEEDQPLVTEPLTANHGAEPGGKTG